MATLSLDDKPWWVGVIVGVPDASRRVGDPCRRVETSRATNREGPKRGRRPAAPLHVVLVVGGGIEDCRPDSRTAVSSTASGLMSSCESIVVQSGESS